jgi:hypothetical protein
LRRGALCDRGGRRDYLVAVWPRGVRPLGHLHYVTEPNTAEWIIAFSGVFAALGTVGAVAVALWQVQRQGRRNVKVTCGLAATPEEYLVGLRAVNEGPKAVELTMAYIETNDGRKVVSPFVAGRGDSLIGGQLLLEGQSAEVFWRQSALAEVRVTDGFDGYWFAFFQDTLGNVYEDTFPGTQRKQRWRLRRSSPLVRRVATYELPAPNEDPLAEALRGSE